MPWLRICGMTPRPREKAIRWLAEEDGLEVEPAESEVLVQRYALSIIFYATGGKKRENKGWIKKANFLSNMSVCHWNEPYSFLGTDCPDGNSEVETLTLSKFLKNGEP